MTLKKVNWLKEDVCVLGEELDYKHEVCKWSVDVMSTICEF